MRRSISKRLLAAGLALCIVLSLTACGGGDENSGTDEKADIVIENAAVYTVDADGTTAEAVAIKDGIIVYVGDSAGAEIYKAEDTQVIDMEGGTVMPGLVDAHMHPAMSATVYMYEISMYDIFTVDEYLTAVADFVAENPDMEVYVGAGFMRSAFDAVGPRKELLDSVCSDKPVIIISADGHSTWVNSKALELAGITKDTADPATGVIQKDPATGEPAGLLQESAANLVDDLIPEYTVDQYKEAILWLQEWFNSVGITTIYDALIPVSKGTYAKSSTTFFQAYKELTEAGQLTLRIRGAWSLAPEMSEEELYDSIDKGIEYSASLTTPYFQVNSFKFFADNVLEEETAYMRDGYLQKPGWKGIKVWEDEDLLKTLFTKIDSEGFQLHIHQIGDAAAEYALDALEATRKVNGPRDSRHTFAHVQFIDDADKLRMSDMGMTAVIAPYWMAMDDYYWDLYLPSVGKKTLSRMYPAKSLLNEGINVAFHSDFFVTEPEPGWLFYGAMTRTIPQRIFDMWYGEDADFGRTADPTVPTDEYIIAPLPTAEERMTLAEAVKAATYGGAYANFMEDTIGSIEVGKAADLTMFTDNIFELDVEDIAEIWPVATIFDGAVVYMAEE